jgi:multiple antibiotic resistance protein
MFEHLSPVWQHISFIVPVTFMALFHVVNPIGSGILFLNLTPAADDKTRRLLAWKIAVNSFFLMVVVLLAGIYIMKLFGITIPIVQICGGTMIMSMGWRSLNRDDSSNESDRKTYIKSDIESSAFPTYNDKVFYPFTFPFTVGPGSIAVTLTVSAESITGTVGNDFLQYLGAIVSLLLIAVTIYICYSSANYFMARISESVRRVIMKIMSFILLCIGGQIFFGGITAYIKGLHKDGLLGFIGYL